MTNGVTLNPFEVKTRATREDSHKNKVMERDDQDKERDCSDAGVSYEGGGVVWLQRW